MGQVGGIDSGGALLVGVAMMELSSGLLFIVFFFQSCFILIYSSRELNGLILQLFNGGRGSLV